MGDNKVTCTHTDVTPHSRVHIIKWVWFQNSHATCNPLCKFLDPPLVGVALLAVCLDVCDLGQVPDQDDIIRDYFGIGSFYQLILCFLSAITYHSVR